MSIVIALKVASGDMVLAVDQRAIAGDPKGDDFVYDNQVKYVTFRTGAIGMSDHVGFLWKPLNEALANIDKDIVTDPLNTIIESLRTHYNKAWPWTKKSEETTNERPDAQLVYVDVRYGVSRMYTLHASRNFTEYVMSDTIQIPNMSYYARYLHSKIWNDNFTIDQAINLAVLMVQETGSYDSKVGRIPKIIKITKCKNEPVIEILPQSTIDCLIEENKRRLSDFAALFALTPSN